MPPRFGDELFFTLGKEDMLRSGRSETSFFPPWSPPTMTRGAQCQCQCVNANVSPEPRLGTWYSFSRPDPTFPRIINSPTTITLLRMKGILRTRYITVMQVLTPRTDHELSIYLSIYQVSIYLSIYLTLLVPQSRFGDKLLRIWMHCLQNGTAVLTGYFKEYFTCRCETLCRICTQ